MTADGTDLQLIRFDFAANSQLRFEMYDQDQDGPKPWADHVAYFAMGVAQAARHLDSTGRGRVIAATNGLYFGATGYGPRDFSSHVAPVVVSGSVHAATGHNVRWTFGVKYVAHRPHFLAMHAPAPADLAGKFDFAAGGAQALVLDGTPAASPAEQSHRESSFESMRTSRVAWGWSRDNRNLYLLFVKEPDEEHASKVAAKHHLHQGGGWMLSDERRLFVALGAWAAFNSDAGDVAQMLLARSDGKYDLIPSTNSGLVKPLLLNADKSGAPVVGPAPAHGSLMYWYVRDVSRK